MTNLEYLGNDMTEAGNEFGVNTPYGSALVRVGQTEQRSDHFDQISGQHGTKVRPLGTKVRPLGTKVRPLGTKVKTLGSKLRPTNEEGPWKHG